MNSGNPEPSRVCVERFPAAPSFAETAPDPCVLVIFGITGDLAHRKLLPALYRLHQKGLLPERFAILGQSRRNLSVDALRDSLRESVQRSLGSEFDAASWQRFVGPLCLSYGPLDQLKTYEGLRDRVNEVDRASGTLGNRIYYLAIPPDEFGVVLQSLASVGLVYPPSGHSRPWSRAVVEKPFGRDLRSARELNELVARYFDENQTFRIDHYLGKETVQNILVFRFANSLFEPIWNRRHIDYVEITAAETLGVEKRGKFYDQAGVIRDIVQNHLLQVLTLSTMEAPVSFDADDIRDQKLTVLREIRPLSSGSVASHAVVGQYSGYHAEDGVARDSRTPTFVAMKLFIDNWRWQGVPFYLRAGKRLARQVTEVSIHFQPVPLCLFPPGPDRTPPEHNILTLRIQPEEGISLRFEAKIPGEHMSVGSVSMRMTYADTFHKPLSDAYERLLLDCMRGDATLFARRAFVEQAWSVLAPLLTACDEGTLPLTEYQPASAGPKEVDAWVARDGKRLTQI